jgi:hypothetical protein
MAKRERPAHVDDDRYAGSQARGGYRVVPNHLLDSYIPVVTCAGGPAAALVFQRIWRETCGYGETKRVLSVSYLQKGTLISRSQVGRALEWLYQAGFIERNRIVAGTERRMNNRIAMWKCEYRIARQILARLYRPTGIDPDEEIEPDPVLFDPDVWVAEQAADYVNECVRQAQIRVRPPSHIVDGSSHIVDGSSHIVDGPRPT